MLHSNTFPLVNLWILDDDATPCTNQWRDAWLLQWLYSKSYFVMNLFNLSKTTEQEWNVPGSSVRIKIASKIRHNIKRIGMVIEWWCFVNKHHGLAREPWRKKNNGFVGIDSRHWSRVGLINKLKSRVRFTQDPNHSIYKRFSQPRLG